MKKIIALWILFLSISAPVNLNAEPNTPEAIKSKLIALARSFEGQPDPDTQIQTELDYWVNALLKASPQPPVSERLPLLHGAWRQIWGPYDYRNKKRGLDPNISPNQIYQVVFPGGYYYNVNPEKKDPEKNRIALLRGEYELNSKNNNALNVHFTQFPGNIGVPETMRLWDLPHLAETKTLPNPVRIVPTLIVKLFFGGGVLEEVYTDETLRITYGSGKLNSKDRYLYIMERVPYSFDF